MRALITLCFASLAATTALAQSQPTMLSQSRYRIQPNNTGIMEDSLIHKHSGGRVSFGLPEVEYAYCPDDGIYTADESVRVYKSTSGSTFMLADKMTRTFNSAGLLAEYREQIKPGTLYKEAYKEWYHYNANMQLDTAWATNYQDDRRLVYTYQNNVQRTKRYETYVPASGTWNLYGIDSFIANGTDSFYRRWELLPNPWLYEQHSYQRDANLRVVVDSFTVPVKGKGVIYTDYDATGKKLRDSVLMAPTYDFRYKIDYQYDNNGNLVVKSRSVWNTGSSAFVEFINDSMTYNAVNQLTLVHSFTLTNNKWVPYPGSYSRIYYYGFPAGVADVAKEKNLRLYPVPATTYINIDMNFDKPEKFSVRIMSVNGQILRSWSEEAQSTYKKQIQLDGMPAGNYIVHVVSENNSITRQFSVLQ